MKKLLFLVSLLAFTGSLCCAQQTVTTTTKKTTTETQITTEEVEIPADSTATSSGTRTNWNYSRSYTFPKQEFKLNTTTPSSLNNPTGITMPKLNTNFNSNLNNYNMNPLGNQPSLRIRTTGLSNPADSVKSAAQVDVLDTKLQEKKEIQDVSAPAPTGKALERADKNAYVFVNFMNIAKEGKPNKAVNTLGKYAEQDPAVLHNNYTFNQRKYKYDNDCLSKGYLILHAMKMRDAENKPVFKSKHIEAIFDMYRNFHNKELPAILAQAVTHDEYSGFVSDISKRGVFKYNTELINEAFINAYVSTEYGSKSLEALIKSESNQRGKDAVVARMSHFLQYKATSGNKVHTNDVEVFKALLNANDELVKGRFVRVNGRSLSIKAALDSAASTNPAGAAVFSTMKSAVDNPKAAKSASSSASVAAPAPAAEEAK